VAEAAAGPEWVVDGNYSVSRDIVWGRADTLVWLDYAFPVTFGRLLRRTVRRIARREELWNGNRESLGKALSRDSILLWALRTYSRRRRDYPRVLAKPEHAHLAVVRLATPSQAERWLSGAGPTCHWERGTAWGGPHRQ
jgi:hypothetical protein